MGAMESAQLRSHAASLTDDMGDPQDRRHRSRATTDRATWSQFLSSQAEAILAYDFLSIDLLDGSRPMS